jgi:hypothetical protein
MSGVNICLRLVLVKVAMSAIMLDDVKKFFAGSPATGSRSDT